MQFIYSSSANFPCGKDEIERGRVGEEAGGDGESRVSSWVLEIQVFACVSAHMRVWMCLYIQ